MKKGKKNQGEYKETYGETFQPSKPGRNKKTELRRSKRRAFAKR